MNESQEEELLQILRDTRALLRLALRDQLAELQEKLFGNEEQQIEAFRLFHRGKSYRGIGERVGVSHATVARWVDSWRNAQLVHPTEQRCLVTPEALGFG